MAKKLYSLEIKGKYKKWSFDVFASEENVKEWKRDGLNLYLVENTVPVYIASLGKYPVKIWCFIQDIFNFRIK
jgi:hypothetical protein